MTAHTTNPVPFILCGAGSELRPGRLADIAPTILDVMGLACPPEMDGETPVSYTHLVLQPINTSSPMVQRNFLWPS